MRLSQVILSGFALACVLHASDAQAWCRSTTRRASIPGECSTNGQPLGWRGVCIGFSLFADGSPEIPFSVLAAESELSASRWRQVACDADSTTQAYFELLRISDTWGVSGYNPRGANSNAVSFNEVWRLDAMHRSGTIAITVVTFDTISGEILDADIEMNQASDRNPEGFRFTVGPANPDTADLPTILTHEFGHFLGLSHSTVDTAIMWPEAGLGEQRRVPRSDDAEGICTIYNPQFVPDRTCNPLPYGGLATDSFGGRTVGAACTVSPATTTHSPNLNRSPRITAALAGLICVVLAALTRRKRVE